MKRPRLDKLKKPGLFVIAALVGAFVALAAIGLVPPVRQTIGPAALSARVTAGNSGTRMLVPPLGTITARTHWVPMTLEVSLTEVDVTELTDGLSQPGGTRVLRGQIEKGLRRLGIELGVRVLIGGIFLGAVATAVLPRRRWPYVMSAAAGGGAAVAIVLAVTAVTFNVAAFEEPRFTGELTRAPVVIAALNRGTFSLPEVTSRFTTAADRLSDVMGLLARPNVDPRIDSTAILHVSDIHSNPVGVEIARQLARRFEVDAIVDTGDLTNFGVDLETRIVDQLRRMPVPYYFVPGNHDSAEVRRAVEALPNAELVSRQVVEIEGIRFLGWPDPTYTNWNLLPPGEAAEIRLAEGDEVAAAVVEEAPDVLVVHDHRVAEASFGLVPLILSGHYHRAIDEHDRGTRLLAVGSTGASGLKTFTQEVDLDYEAEVVYFSGGRAIAIDYIRFSGLGGNFEVSRRSLIDPGPLVPPGSEDAVDEEPAPVPADVPTPTPTG
ncbi:MAG: metallophosphoesterase family protein [Actinomycetota bacterium]